MCNLVTSLLFSTNHKDRRWGQIARMVLSSKPYVVDESEALRDMLMGLGTM